MSYFSVYGYIKRNKFKYMIIISIIVIMLLFLFKNLSSKNKEKFINIAKNKYIKTNKIYRKIKKDSDIYNIIYDDIYSDSNVDDKLIIRDIDSSINKKKRFMPMVSNGEMKCKLYLEKIFNKPFEKIRPDILKNSVTGKNLELDLYNDELKLAIEYNGEQHYKFFPKIHKNYEHFQTQKYRDEMKKMLCQRKGITLIEVPYTEKNNIENYLFQQLNIKGFGNKLIN